VLDAAKLTSLQCPQICFVFLGSGVELESLRQHATKAELDNVYFLPAVPMTEVGGLLAEADALLVHLKKDPLFQITIPSKTQAYMAVGKPILMAVDGDAAELVQKGDCGVIAESQSPESIATAAIELFKRDASARIAMGENSRKFYQQHLSLKVGAKRFGDIFRRLSDRASKNGGAL
jgi:glycosyltransferase involved in cell wall biosynthesis